ncbi:MAG TPA: NAD(P)/FAD-dependent oxidoreductase [Burkholderiaceae bacterium]|jgi:thioredoxin reductase (NADPH)|nr:NAD(P)/FAD-dependent oxidoreductase [Burkholderiaceae bacterium]
MSTESSPLAAQAATTLNVGTAGADAIETDAVVIGAGPVGLFQVFELGLLEIKAQVVDSLPRVGGQCMELYPDKPIYDIPAVPVCSGRELTESLLKQIAPFHPTFHLGQTVTALQRQDDGRFALQTSRGTRFLTRTVIIAAGVGAFEPRRLRVEGIADFENAQLFYRVRDPADFAAKRLVIAGGGDSALDWALNFAREATRSADTLVLVHRRHEFRAAPSNVGRMRELVGQSRMRLLIGQITGFEQADGCLTALQVTGVEDQTVTRVPLDALLVFFGLSPRLGPIADWGLDLERRAVAVDTERFETNVAGVFAVGDINIYPGKKKLILSGFHEAALAAFGAARYVFPNKPIHLQYTTTSTKVHKLLGVEPPAHAGPAR